MEKTNFKVGDYVYSVEQNIYNNTEHNNDMYVTLRRIFDVKDTFVGNVFIFEYGLENIDGMCFKSINGALEKYPNLIII